MIYLHMDLHMDASYERDLTAWKNITLLFFYTLDYMFIV